MWPSKTTFREVKKVSKQPKNFNTRLWVVSEARFRSQSQKIRHLRFQDSKYMPVPGHWGGPREELGPGPQGPLKGFLRVVLAPETPPQDPPGCFQDAHRCPQDASKTHPRRPQDAPRRPKTRFWWLLGGDMEQNWRFTLKPPEG